MQPTSKRAGREPRSQKPARLIISPGIFDTSTAKSFKASSVPVIVTLGLTFLGFLAFLAFRPFDFFALDFFFAAIMASSHRVSRNRQRNRRKMDLSS